MRLLHVIPTYLPATRYGGPIYSVHGLCKALVRAGHEVHVFTTSVNGENDSQVKHGVPVELDGVTVWYFQSWLLRRLYYAPDMKSVLANKISEFDIVHLHSVFLWPTFMAAGLAFKNNIPYLLSPRGMLVGELLRRKNYLLKYLWIMLFERRNIRHAAGLHVTSSIELKEISSLGLDLVPAHIIANGCDVPDTLENGNRQNVKPYALYLGRINWKKRLDRLIDAWQKVSGLDLLIAGPDDENYSQMLMERIRVHNLSDRITLMGEVSGNEKWPLFANARLFILPSISENFGNVVLEAMVRGCPVIVTDGVGLAEEVKKNQAGLVIDGSIESISSSVNQLNQDREAHDSMGQNGRHLAMTKYSWDVIAKDMVATYQKILNQ